MSVLLSSDEGWIVSHGQYFEFEVDDFDFEEGKEVKQVISLRLNPKIFEIKSPFKSVKSGTNNQLQSNEEEESNFHLNNNSNDNGVNLPAINNNCGETALKISTLWEKLLRNGKNSGIFTQLSGDDKKDNNIVARKTAIEFYDSIKDFVLFPEFTKINDEGIATKTLLFDGAGNFHNFILPKDSVVHCDKIRNLQNLVEDNKYSLIVMDPPWRNKYIRRRKRKQSEAGYQMMEDCDISKLPIKELANDNAIIAVWCTNSQTHQTKVIQEFFPSWEVDYLATWYWLKVTQEGLPICPFNQDTKKQPFESIILGRRKPQEPQEESPALLLSAQQLSPDSKLIISVPSSINSHKPPLVEVLRPYVNERELNSGNCIELFARYALPGFTSVGDQVLKLMLESLFVPVSK